MMNFIYGNKDKIGKILFAVSVILFIALVFIPTSTIITNMDEHFSLALVKLTGANFWITLINDVHPPLYYFIIKAVYNTLNFFNITANMVYTLKLVSIITYLIILLVSLVVIRKRYGWYTTGLFTFSLITMSRFFIQFQLMRMYSLAILLMFLTFIVYMELIENFDNKNWIFLTVLTILGSYTHNILLITLFLIYLFILAYITKTENSLIDKKTQYKKWLISAGISVLAYLPWTFILIHQITNRVVEPSLQSILDVNILAFHVTALTQNSFDILVIKILAILFLVSVTVIAFRKFYNKRNVENFEIFSGISIYLLTLLIAGVLVIITFKPLEARFFLPVLAIFWLSVSILTSKITNKKLFCILTVLIIVMGCYGICQTLSETGDVYSKATKDLNTIEKINNNGDVIIYNLMVQYNFYHQYFTNSKEYILFPNANLPSDVTVETNISKIITDNPDKNVYIIETKYANLDHIKTKKVSKMGGRTIYKLEME